MKQFFHDMIHMTEGERLINYWWLWLGIVGIAVAWSCFTARKR